MRTWSLTPDKFITDFVHRRRNSRQPIVALSSQFKIHPEEFPEKAGFPWETDTRKHRKAVSNAILLNLAAPEPVQKSNKPKHSQDLKAPQRLGRESVPLHLIEQYTPVPRIDRDNGLLGTARQPDRQRSRESTVKWNIAMVSAIQTDRSPAISDIHWIRALRQRPSGDLRQLPTSPRTDRVSTGSLKLRLHAGTSVTKGKALVTVSYPYCRSCMTQRASIPIHVFDS